MREAGKKDPAITCFRTLRHYHRLWKLNGRVRNGNECDLPDMVTGIRQQGGEATAAACSAVKHCCRVIQMMETSVLLL